MTRFGTDKPDLRYSDIELHEVTESVKLLNCQAFQDMLSCDEPAYALKVKHGHKLSRSVIHNIVQSNGVKNFIRISKKMNAFCQI